jgi:hypothetical protein
MIRFKTLWILSILLAACSSNWQADCAFAAATGATAAAPQGTPCPTRTPPAQASANPATAGPGLGKASSALRSITATSGSETLLAVGAGEGGSAIAYLDESGRLVVVGTPAWGKVQFNSGADSVGLAFGSGRAAMIVASGSAALYLSDTAALHSAIVPTAAPVGASGVAAAFDFDNGLIVVGGGASARFDLTKKEWETLGGYGGRALRLSRARDSVLLLTDAGVYRYENKAWSQTWGGAGVGLATRGDQALVTMQGSWQVALSTDGGRSWRAENAASGSPGQYGIAFPLIRFDGTFEVTGMFTEGGSDHAVVIVARRRADGSWYPPPGAIDVESLFPNTSDVPAASSIKTASENGAILIGIEVTQLNGGRDVAVISR